MANSFKVTNKVAKTMCEFMVQKNPIINTANRNYQSEFNTAGGYAPGETVNAKIPKSQVVTTGLADNVRGINDKIVPITLTESDMYNVTEELSVIEELLDVVGGSKALTDSGMKAMVDNYGVPTYLAINGALEKKAASQLQDVAYMTPVDEPSKLKAINTFSDISQVRQIMNDMKFPGMRYGMMNTEDSRGVSDSLQNMFNSAINKGITESALIGGTGNGRLAGFDMFESPEIVPHTPIASVAASVLIKVASVGAGGGTINLKDLPINLTPALKKGDLISIPSVFLIDNPTKTVKKWKLVVKVIADANSDGAGLATVTISDPLVATGQIANVSALPAVDAPVKVYPEHNNNYFYVPSGITAVPLPIKDIKGAENSDIKYSKNDVPIKCVAQGNVLSFQNAFRTSMLCGVKAFADYVIVVPSLV